MLPVSSPVDWSRPEVARVKVAWRPDVSPLDRRRLEAQMLPDWPYRAWVDEAYRPEEVMATAHDHIWEAVNSHVGTDAFSFPELVAQLGIMRFGQRPRVADTFCGSGHIPFEAARLGCNVHASDLNPFAFVSVARFEKTIPPVPWILFGGCQRTKFSRRRPGSWTFFGHIGL